MTLPRYGQIVALGNKFGIMDQRHTGDGTSHRATIVDGIKVARSANNAELEALLMMALLRLESDGDQAGNYTSVDHYVQMLLHSETAERRF